MKKVSIIGAGLAGCEAAYQLAKRGVAVTLYEMKPNKKSPAHRTDRMAELVCSNSLRANNIENAVGLLKEELRLLDSLIIKIADETRVPAGGALAVDRNLFSERITDTITNHPLIDVVHDEVTALPDEGIVIIATGPLTSDALAKSIEEMLGQQYLSFYDAAAPIVTKESINMDVAFYQSRYDKGGDDYLNCPMNREEYDAFYQALISAETAALKEFETLKVFEGCMPVEVMAKRGVDTLRYGPLKPVGLMDERSGKKPYAVVQLRKENKKGSLFNLVGFQTNLKHGEQKRVFGMIPGLEKAEFVRLGVMHRNTFINAPSVLNNRYQMKNNADIYFAGQITGVEGYVESTASGLLAGLYAAADVLDIDIEPLDNTSAIGALAMHVSQSLTDNFQPMNINFAIIKSLETRIKQKKLRNGAIAERAIAYLEDIKRRNALWEAKDV
ncbi:MAG: methylenetetrahydrofolate--tRNA-(uracil(54)-C(5))-methyltransferase (FADH(2)-oxidizing) TrmFO [Eubacteriales bacterium]